MLTRMTVALLFIVCALSAQQPYPPLPDESGVVAAAEKKLAADPDNLELLVALGRAQASVLRFDDAIATYTKAIAAHPNNALLHRLRGHRFISVRKFDRAVEDLRAAAILSPEDFDVLYLLGLALHLRGEWYQAATVYMSAMDAAKTDDHRAAATYWAYLNYLRLDRQGEATSLLNRISPQMKVQDQATLNVLLFFKEAIGDGEILDPKSVTALGHATVGYALGTWFLAKREVITAREYLRRVVNGPAWHAFGYIAAEAELARAPKASATKK